MNGEAEFIDSENYQANKEGYGFKEIVLEQYRRVVLNYSKEFRKGFWIHSEQPMRNPTKIRYVGDSRKELRNSIDCLHDILLAKFDDEMKEASEKAFETLKKMKEQYAEEDVDVWKVVWEIYRELFRQLSLFMDRLGWLEGQEATDDE